MKKIKEIISNHNLVYGESFSEKELEILNNDVIKGDINNFLTTDEFWHYDGYNNYIYDDMPEAIEAINKDIEPLISSLWNLVQQTWSHDDMVNVANGISQEMADIYDEILSEYDKGENNIRLAELFSSLFYEYENTEFCDETIIKKAYKILGELEIDENGLIDFELYIDINNLHQKYDVPYTTYDIAIRLDNIFDDKDERELALLDIIYCVLKKVDYNKSEVYELISSDPDIWKHPNADIVKSLIYNIEKAMENIA